jgi:dolichol-phosphate mannosyltransferase
VSDGSSGEGAVARRRLTLLSVVVPMLNEAATVEAFYKRLSTALDGLEWEVIAVDDGSSDETLGLLRRLAESDPRVRAIRLSRNFGHQAALTAGLDHARGDAVVTIDADLQDPPDVIRRMVTEWEGGADVVHGVRESRPGEPRWRLAAMSFFYRLFAKLARIKSVPYAGDFRLVDRQAVTALASMRESNRYLRGMSVWIGFEQQIVKYDRDERFAGETKYPLGKLIEFAFDAIVSFSFVPLRVAAIMGFVVSALALIAIPVVIAVKVTGTYVPGIASVTIVVLLLGGIQLLTIGVMGEYVGRSYEESKHRPIYVVRELVNLEWTQRSSNDR